MSPRDDFPRPDATRHRERRILFGVAVFYCATAVAGLLAVQFWAGLGLAVVVAPALALWRRRLRGARPPVPAERDE